MVNVLPTKDLKRVLWEHRRRILVMVLIFIMCSVVLAMLFAIPSAIVVWPALGGFQDQLEATKTLVDLQRKQSGGDVVSDLQTRTDALEATLLQRSPTEILADIAPRIPSGVRVQQFTYSFADGKTAVSILGNATTRNALITFGAALRQSALFSRVDVPVSSLAKSDNIDFNLTLVLVEPTTLAPVSVPPQAHTDTPIETATEQSSTSSTQQ